MTASPIRIREAALSNVADIAILAKQHQLECAPHLPFEESSIARSFAALDSDEERRHMNCWIAYKEGQAIGYAVGTCSQFFFNEENCAKLEILYVLPAFRGSWAAIRLVKQFEEWSRLNESLQLYVGVARLDADEAKHIRKLFPKLGYDWCGSYYVKETVR